ncbi:MAG: ATP-binding protein [Desulfobacterales bacterium]|nr:ATP-binding protein [Desulfobacterales bacterium]
MILTIASGKGGTGKTTVAAALAAVWPSPVTAVDLDVEEPNLHLFLKPQIASTATAALAIPEIDDARCTRCRICTDICQFKAIGIFGDVVMTFPEMCHGCGACWTLCPQQAITPGKRALGEILTGRGPCGEFTMGRLRVGEAMSPPLIRGVKARLNGNAATGSRDVIIDAPPGVSCPALNAVMDADVIVLVTEPTPFGLYDLVLAQKAFAPLEIPMGVIINRADVGTPDVRDHCRRTGLPILAEIAFAREIAEAYARGGIIVDAVPAARPVFESLARRIMALADREAPPEETCHA